MLNSTRGFLVSMLTVLKHLFKKPVTLEYPEKERILPDTFRGKPTVNGCIKCGTCIKVCPSGAIKIEDDEFKINLNKCIICGNCEYYCPKQAIKMSSEYKLASSNHEDLNITYNIAEEEKNV